MLSCHSPLAPTVCHATTMDAVAPEFLDDSGSGSRRNDPSTPAVNRTCDIGSGVSAEDNIFLFITLGVSLSVAILYSFLQKRRSAIGDCTVPSIVSPVNLVQSTPERWVYVLLFGSLSGVLLLTILTNGFAFANEANNSIAGATVSTILLMFIISLQYYPAFASVRAPIPIVGYIIGFFFTTILFSETYVKAGVAISDCVESNPVNVDYTTTIGVIVAALTPVTLSHLVVSCWFLYKIPREIYRLVKSDKPFKEAVYELPEDQRASKRVKWLLSKWHFDPTDKEDQDIQEAAEEITVDIKGKLKQKMAVLMLKFFKYFVYKYDPYIYYPIRFLAAVIIMVYIIYILTLSVTLLIILNVVPLVDVVRNASDEVQLLSDLVMQHESLSNYLNLSQALAITFDIVLDSTIAISVILPTAPLLSFVTCMVLLLHMIRAVHVHLKKISKGDYDFLPEQLASPAYRLVHCMQYVGFQIGYFTWAWILLTLSVWLVGVAGLILYFLLKFFLDTVIRVGVALVTPLVYSFGIYYVTLVFTKFVFVGDTNNKHVVISNLRLFHLFSYILVFQNAVVGITSAFIRILYSVMFGLLLLFRLDRVVLMKGFEKFDKGHKAYIGFIYLEHTLNNAVLNCFVDLLLGGHRRRKYVEKKAFRDKSTSLAVTQLEDWIEKDTYPRRSQRALNRWGVAYTLIHNPSLVQYTATNLALKRENEKKKKKRKKKLNAEPTSSNAPTPVQPDDDVLDCTEGQDLNHRFEESVPPPDTPQGENTSFTITGVEDGGEGKPMMEMVEVGGSEREDGEDKEVADLAENGGLGEHKLKPEEDENPVIVDLESD